MNEMPTTKNTGNRPARSEAGGQTHSRRGRTDHGTQKRNRSCADENFQPNTHRFTTADHLLVQAAIEYQAYQFWVADNRDSSHRFDHWILAERLVLADLFNIPAAPL